MNVGRIKCWFKHHNWELMGTLPMHRVHKITDKETDEGIGKLFKCTRCGLQDGTYYTSVEAIDLDVVWLAHEIEKKKQKEAAKK